MSPNRNTAAAVLSSPSYYHPEPPALLSDASYFALNPKRSMSAYNYTLNAQSLSVYNYEYTLTFENETLKLDFCVVENITRKSVLPKNPGEPEL